MAKVRITDALLNKTKGGDLAFGKPFTRIGDPPCSSHVQRDAFHQPITRNGFGVYSNGSDAFGQTPSNRFGER